MAHLVLLIFLLCYGPLVTAAPVVAAALSATIAGTTIAVGATAALSIGFSVSTFFTSLALSAFSGLLNKKPKTSSAQDVSSEARSSQQVLRSSNEPRRIIYGQAMVSGPLVFATTAPTYASQEQVQWIDVPQPANSRIEYGYEGNSEGYGGDKVYVKDEGTVVPAKQRVVTNTQTINLANGRLIMVIPLAGHEVQEIGDVYFDDQLALRGDVVQAPFSGAVSIGRNLGSPDQPADSYLIPLAPSLWTSAHRLRGVAYIWVVFDYNESIFPNGIPNIKAVVKGKKVYDPRTNTTAYSNNWALCIRDYLLSADGLGCAADEIHEASFIAAANICDETVALQGGGTQKRYTCDGAISLADKPMDIAKRLLTAGAGSVVYTQGAYRCYAGAYTTPVKSLSESDLRGPISVRPSPSRKETYNAVRGTYVDPSKYWQPGDFPIVKNSLYQTQDGEYIARDIELPFTTDPTRAQRIAKIHLEKSRQSIVVDFPAKFTAFKLGIWDRVTLSIAQLGWTSKVFLVTGWKFANGGVDLVLQEDAPESYEWNSGNETIVDPAPNTNLPNARYCAPPGVPAVYEMLYAGQGSSGVKARAVVNWSSSPDVFVRSYELDYQLVGGTQWTAAASGIKTTEFSIDDIPPGRYDFRVRAVNVFGAASAYSTARKELLGLSAPPSDLTNFTAIKIAGVCLAQWDLHPDLDVQQGGRIVIKHSPLTSGATWADGIPVQEFSGATVSGMVPLITGTYLAKARDSSGNDQLGTASFVMTEGMVTGYTTVATSTQHSSFTGSKTNLTVTSSKLELTVTGITAAATGTYLFDTYLDCTTVKTRRFEADIEAQSYATDDYFDSTTEFFDEGGLFDGEVIGDCGVALYVATTDDNPAGSPTWGPWVPFLVGEFTCRAAKFKLEFTRGLPTHNIRVSTLRVHIKEPV